MPAIKTDLLIWDTAGVDGFENKKKDELPLEAFMYWSSIGKSPLSLNCTSSDICLVNFSKF